MTNLNRFDLATLRLYLAVVDAGSLTGGAERFGISLAAASKRVAELEQHCGSTLLERGHGGVAVTPAGQVFRSQAIEVVARLEQLALAMDDLRGGTAGHLRLWANSSAFGGFLPSLLADYAARHPDVRLDLTDALSEDAVRAVMSGGAELAVIGDNTPTETLQTLLADVDELVLLAPAGHPLAGGARAALVDVLDNDLVTLARGASLTRKLSAAAEAAGRLTRVRVQVRSFDAMARMVAAGLGLAVLPRAAAATYARTLDLRVVELDSFDATRRLLLAMRDRAALSGAARALVEMVEARMAAVQTGARA